MKNILVIPNTLKDTDLSVTSRVIEKLTEFGMTALVSAEFSGRFDGKIEYFT